MDIRRIDVSDQADFAAWYAVYEAAQEHDVPGGPRWLEHECRVAYESSAAYDTTLWLAEDGDAPVGGAALELPLKDNPRLGEVELMVHQDARRRGIGTALLAEIEKQAADGGRSSLVGYVTLPLAADGPPGAAFAERHGFTSRLVEVSRVQRPPFDLERLEQLEREALPHAAGYEVVTWRDPIPEAYLDAYARMLVRLSTDAPLGELDYEAEVWDAERVRSIEERRVRMNRGAWSAIAITPDGAVVGQTSIVLANDSDRTAFQNETIVDPEHRGHRLGLLIKIANLRQLLAERPGLQATWTWNADSNTHMNEVNELLGYVPFAKEAAYQRDL